MAENVKQGCTGDCKMCTLFQRQYCSAQITYTNMGLLSSLISEVKSLGEKIAAIQSNEATLFNPIQKEFDFDAQEASGASEKTA